MNIVLWILQVLAALVYGASGVMKVFMFDRIREQVPSFGALPREAWMALGILELVCTVGLRRLHPSFLLAGSVPPTSVKRQGARMKATRQVSTRSSCCRTRVWG